MSKYALLFQVGSVNGTIVRILTGSLSCPTYTDLNPATAALGVIAELRSIDNGELVLGLLIVVFVVNKVGAM